MTQIYDPNEDRGASIFPSAGGALSDLWTPEDEAAGSTHGDDVAQVLFKAGVITGEQFTAAQHLHRKTPGKTIGDVLYESGVDEVVIQQTIARQFNMPFERVESLDMEVNKHLERLTVDFCHRHWVLPIRLDHGRVILGVVHPDNLPIIDEVRHKLAVPVKAVVVTRADIESVVMSRKAEEAADELEVDDIIADIDEDDIEVVESKEEDLDLEKMAGESPVIRFVNYLIFNAVKEGASDIHIEPQEKKLKIRYRIDGILFESMNPPAHMHAAMISRLKIMANLDISERRLPQDGRIRAVVHGRKLDLRLSTLPTAQGEKAVMRILDTRAIQVQLDDLGFDEDALLMWKHQIDQPHGIILVTGPTGSGKTTTLYASLSQMDRSKLNISTVEDPVEYHLNGISQCQVHEKIGMTFSTALRALLRQDPDVVMVGEIRDHDTAKTAIQASLTGHLVLSTLHTNDAPSSVTRLINIGVEPYLIGAAVNAALAQRLVRKICEHCKARKRPDDAVADALAVHGIPFDQVCVGEGCDKCRGTGYAGRVGLYELLVFNDQLRDKVCANPNVSEFRRMCVESGMVTLREDGFRKVAKGMTTIDEVLRVTEATI